MAKVNIKINNIPLQVEENTRVIDAAKLINIDIPHLCYHPDQEVKAHCRMCVVEVAGSRKLTAACSTLVWDGMEIRTDTQRVRKTQVGILELILANHDQDCLNCARNGNCDLQNLCSRFNVHKQKLPSVLEPYEVQQGNPSIVRDLSKCIKCGRCVKACSQYQGIAALSYTGRAENFYVTTAYNEPMENTDCVLCGQCSAVCPVGAIVEKDDTDKVLEVLHDPKKHVVVQVAPAVRVALGDAFWTDAKGKNVTGKMVTALKMMGFDRVFDTVFAADVTILEEGNELLERINTGGKLPMITSCSPGWINYMEKHHPEYVDHLSSTKSPQQIFGALSKTYYAKQAEIDPKDIVTVSIMPCVAKKYEASRAEMENADGIRDVDIVLTTREFTKLIKYVGIDFISLPDSEFDDPLGKSTGAGVIFGTTGGVMEAALRTVAEVVTGEELDAVEFTAVRGNEGIKEAVIALGDTSVKVAVAHGLKNAEEIMRRVKSGECDYTFIEVMACPGGCIGGGGQPVNSLLSTKKIRQESLYEIDSGKKMRKSHENPDVLKLYEEFLEKPLGHLSHELLHTHYHQQKKLDHTNVGK